MKLYHGSNADIKCINLSNGLRYKDFGKGFYLTPELSTAIRMSQWKYYERTFASPNSDVSD